MPVSRRLGGTVLTLVTIGPDCLPDSPTARLVPTARCGWGRWWACSPCCLLCFFALRETTRQFVGQFVGRGVLGPRLSSLSGVLGGTGTQRRPGCWRFSCVFSRFFLFALVTFLLISFRFVSSRLRHQNVSFRFRFVSFRSILLRFRRNPYTSRGSTQTRSFDSTRQESGLDFSRLPEASFGNPTTQPMKKPTSLTSRPSLAQLALWQPSHLTKSRILQEDHLGPS